MEFPFLEFGIEAGAGTLSDNQHNNVNMDSSGQRFFTTYYYALLSHLLICKWKICSFHCSSTTKDLKLGR